MGQRECLNVNLCCVHLCVCVRVTRAWRWVHAWRCLSLGCVSMKVARQKGMWLKKWLQVAETWLTGGIWESQAGFVRKNKSVINYIYSSDSERFDHRMICVCVPIVLIELVREVRAVLKKPMRVCCNPEVQQSRLRGFRAPPYFCCFSQRPPLSSRKLDADIAHGLTTTAGTDRRKSLEGEWTRDQL